MIIVNNIINNKDIIMRSQVFSKLSVISATPPPLVKPSSPPTIELLDGPLINTWTDENDVVHSRCMIGNGDLWWTYTKLKVFNKKICFHLCSHFSKEDNIIYSKAKSRSLDLLNLISDDITYVMENVTLEQMDKIYKNPFPLTMSYDEVLSNIKEGTQYSMCINKHMEDGHHLNDVLPSLKSKYEILDTKSNSNYNKNLVDSCNKDTVFIHVATYGKDKAGWSDINAKTFRALVELLHSFNYKIGLSGRRIDNIDWDNIINIVTSITNRHPILLIDEHISTCIEAVKRSKCSIGPINGFLIIAHTQGANIFALWPAVLSKMINTISNRDISSKYNHAIITSNINKDNILNVELIKRFKSWLHTI